MATTGLNSAAIEPILERVFDWSRAQDYRGWNKHDGLNSPALRTLLGWGRWPRMIAIQGVMRFPLNLRHLLAVPKTYNPKGLALFTLAALDRYKADEDTRHLDTAHSLLSLLSGMCSPGDWTGDCWGYHYPWQDPGFYAPPNTPNAVVSCFVCEAFLEAYRVTGDVAYLHTVERAVKFFINHLTVLLDTPEELCLAYMPLPMTMRVMDVSILIGTVIAQHATLSGDVAHLVTAERLVRFVVNRQTEDGAWFYTDPPGDSHIRHDNYHTGFILDALDRYRRASGTHEWDTQYNAGLKFYAERLFNVDGAPRWMSDVDFPHDIHGAAQGILTFSRHLADYPGMAERIAAWSIRYMYNPAGRFYYQQGRYCIKRFTLLRWCNAWMARGLAALYLQYREAS